MYPFVYHALPPHPNFIIPAVVYHRKTTTMGNCTCALENGFVLIRVYTTNWYASNFDFLLNIALHPSTLYFPLNYLFLCLSFYFVLYLFLSLHNLSLSLSLSRFLSPALPPHQNFIITDVVYHRKPTTMA